MKIKTWSVRCRPAVKNPSIIYKRADQVNQVDESFIESSPNITMTVRLLVVQNTSCSSGTYCNNSSWYLLLFEDSVPLLFWELTYSVMFSPDQESWFITWCEIISRDLTHQTIYFRSNRNQRKYFKTFSWVWIFDYLTSDRTLPPPAVRKEPIVLWWGECSRYWL